MHYVIDIPSIQMIRFTNNCVEYENILNKMVLDLDTIHHRVNRPYSLQEILSNEFYLFVKNTFVIGYTLLYPNPKECVIKNFLIRKEYRNMGYGSICFQILLSYIKSSPDTKKIVLSVDSDNDKAKKLYTKFGFSKVEQVTNELLCLDV